jgi:hypothetical protein
MEWLLILSALLNAATGAFTGTRSADNAARHEAAVEAVAIAETLSTVAATVADRRRPIDASPRRLEDDPALQDDRPVSSASVQTDRLIE